MTLLFDVDPTLGLRRRQEAPGATNPSTASRPTSTSACVRVTSELARSEPARWVVFDASLHPDDSKLQVWGP